MSELSPGLKVNQPGLVGPGAVPFEREPKVSQPYNLAPVGPVDATVVGSFNGVEYPWQNHVTYASGLFWVFLIDYLHGRYVYLTSATGASGTWSAATAIINEADNSAEVAYYFDGTTVYYARLSEVATTTIYYRHGTLNADGTITWAGAEQSIDVSAAPWSATGTNQTWISVALDSYGNFFIVFGYNSGASVGVWSSLGSSAYLAKTWNPATSNFTQILPLVNGKMAFAAANTAADLSLTFWRWDGVSWTKGPVVQSALWANGSRTWDYFIADGDTVYATSWQLDTTATPNTFQLFMLTTSSPFTAFSAYRAVGISGAGGGSNPSTSLDYNGTSWFYVSTLDFATVANPTEIGYVSSTDGVNWSPPTALLSGQYNTDFPNVGQSGQGQKTALRFVAWTDSPALGKLNNTVWESLFV